MTPDIILLPPEIQARLSDTAYAAERQTYLKQLVGWEIAKRVENGQKLGLGSGSTSEWAIRAIGWRVANEGLQVAGVPTSDKVGELARNMGIAVQDFNPNAIPELDWGFDGADEVERGTLNIIKGGGGAATREKAVAKRCGKWIVIIDESKMVDQLGAFPVMAEVEPDKIEEAQDDLQEYNPAVITLRQKKDGSGTYRTDTGNFILDVQMKPGEIQDEWETEWGTIHGVIDTGLFLGGYADEVLIAHKDGSIETIIGKTALF